RGALAAVVPAAEGADESRAPELRAPGDHQLLAHQGILLGRQSEITSAAVAAQRLAASVTCTSTSHHGKSVRYWISPTAICTKRIPSTRTPKRSWGVRVRASQTRRSASEIPKTAVARTCQYTAVPNVSSRRTSALLPGCGPPA